MIEKNRKKENIFSKEVIGGILMLMGALTLFAIGDGILAYLVLLPLQKTGSFHGGKTIISVLFFLAGAKALDKSFWLLNE